MDARKKALFTRGEFAKLTNVTLFTLRLYDKTGILKPELVGDNGYHYYSETQAQKLLMIDLCIKAGFSLKEIAALQKEAIPPAEMASIYERLQERIYQQLLIYQASENMVSSMLFYHKAWEDHGLDNPFIAPGISFQGFVQTMESSPSGGFATSSLDFIHRIENVMGHPIEFPLSYLIEWNEADDPSIRMLLRTREVFDDQEDFYISQTPDYYVMATEGRLSSVPDILSGLLDHAAKNGYLARGPALVTPVQKYMFSPDDSEIIFVIGVPVEHRRDSLSGS